MQRVGRAGLEPATYGLKVRSSTIELATRGTRRKVGSYFLSGLLPKVSGDAYLCFPGPKPRLDIQRAARARLGPLLGRLTPPFVLGEVVPRAFRLSYSVSSKAFGRPSLRRVKARVAALLASANPVRKSACRSDV